MSNRAVRRKDRQITTEECHQLLVKGEYGVMATVDAAGEPYAVPISFVVMNSKVYFHCAHKGHKIDNIAQNPRVSFVVVGQVETVYTEDYTAYYESVVISGIAHEVTDEQEKYDSLYALIEKYFPDRLDSVEAYIRKNMPPTAVYAIEIVNITGKANK